MFRYTFLSCELQCLPRGDPRNLRANVRIRLLTTHLLLLGGCESTLRNNHHGENMRVCMGIETIALRNKTIKSNSQ